jgi:hypothetical protein
MLAITGTDDGVANDTKLEAYSITGFISSVHTLPSTRVAGYGRC